MATKTSWTQSIRSVGGETLVPIVVVGVVFVMLVPMPAFALDLLLSLSITASVLVLLTAVQLLKPVEFSVFPSLFFCSLFSGFRSTSPAVGASCSTGARASARLAV